MNYFNMTKNIGNKTLKELGIPGTLPKDLWEALGVLKKLEEAGLIKKKRYDIIQPFERHYYPGSYPYN